MSKQERDKLIQETIESILCYSKKLQEGIKKCIDKFQTNKQKEALEILIQITDGLEWIIKAIVLTNILEKRVYIDELNKHCTEIIEAMENKDYILLSDLLEYEINPLLEEITNLVNKYYNKNFINKK